MKMIERELALLSELLTLYGNTYGSDMAAELQTEVQERFTEAVKGEYTTSELLHNERGAGRKAIISDEVRQQVKEAAARGTTYKAISEQYHISPGTIAKILHP